MINSFESVDIFSTNREKIISINNIEFYRKQLISFSGKSGNGKTELCIWLYSQLMKDYNCLYIETENKLSNIKYHAKKYLDDKTKFNLKIFTDYFTSPIESFSILEKEIIENKLDVIFIDSTTKLFNTNTKTTAKAIKIFMNYLKSLSVKYNCIFFTTHWCYLDNYNSTNREKITGERGVKYSSDFVYYTKIITTRSRKLLLTDLKSELSEVVCFDEHDKLNLSQK